MKRIVVSLALALGAVPATAAPAQAAPAKDPVDALKAQYAGRTGVQVTTVRKMTFPKDRTLTLHETGAARFGASGPVAWSLTANRQYNDAFLAGLKEQDRTALEEDRGPVRTVWVRRTKYVAGENFPGRMPENKTWARSSEPLLVLDGPLLDVFEPRTLKTLLADAASSRDGVVKGSITTTKLVSLSPSAAEQYGPRGRFKNGRKATIDYTLWLDANGLVKRLLATTSLPYYDFSVKISSDTHYRGWGEKAAIYAPPAYEVIDRDDPVLNNPPEEILQEAERPAEARASRM